MSMALKNRRSVCGVNPKIAQKICKMCHGYPRSAQEIASAMSVTAVAAENWLVSLAEADYLGVEVKDERLLWFCAPKGYTALVNARSGEPLSGTEFVDLLFEVVRRAKEYNENDSFPLYVDEVYLFGSVISQPWLIEDPDIAITQSVRPAFSKDSGWRSGYWAKREPDKHISVVEQLFFAEDELCRFLKKPKERCSIYFQDISELSDERRLLFRGNHTVSSNADGILMTDSEVRNLGKEIEKYRDIGSRREKRRKARTQNERIAEHWRGSAWFQALNIADEQAARCCWRCGSRQDIQRCHIVPDALGGSSEESNLVLLCARCHAEGPNLQDARIMLDWIRSYRNRYEKDFWLDAAMDEYERIYDRRIRDEVENILSKEQIRMGLDKAMCELKLLVNEASIKATFHFGQTWLNNASMAGCFRLALESLPEHLRKLGER